MTQTFIPKRRFRLRYVGLRFDGAKLPTDVLSDLPAFRDLIVAYAKQTWRSRNSDRKRLPKGFEQSIVFNLVGIEDGSAIPVLEWSRLDAQSTLPGFTNSLEDVVDESFAKISSLLEAAGRGEYPATLPAEHVRALNRLGAGLRETEKIEFSQEGREATNVIYLDVARRRSLITHVSDTYQLRYEGIGRLVGTHLPTQLNADSYVEIETPKFGQLRVPLDAERVFTEFDGYLESDVQFSLQLEVDEKDTARSVVDVFEFDIVSDGVQRCRDRLSELSELGPGWHDGEGSAITAAALESSNRLLRLRPDMADFYHIYPTAPGGLLFEFELSGWDLSVEIHDDGRAELYGIEISGPNEILAQYYSTVDDEFFSAFDAATLRTRR